MNRALLVSLILAFASTAFAGCLGDDAGDLSNAIPEAKVSVTEVAGKVDTFLFDASKSTGRGLSFEWDFGDETTSNEEVVEHSYQYGAGSYDASLTIRDLADVPDIWEGQIVVGDGINEAPHAFFTPSARYLEVGEPLTVDARLTRDPEADPILYEWDFNFIMTEDEYIQFREDKQNADYDAPVTAGSGPSVNEGDGGTGDTPASMPVVNADDATSLLDLGHKDPGHGGESHSVSLFNGFRDSTEPVFTLLEGFPDPTRFFVKLTAYDVKGETADILSEEVWPVLVVENKAPKVYTGELTGTFTAGGPSTLTDNTPENEELQPIYDDQAEWVFVIPNPVIEMYVNVTWSQTPVGDAADEAANDIDIEIESPNQKTRIDTEAEKDISVKLTAADELGAGTWGVDLFGRFGANMEWTATYWAFVDQNPFRDLEAPYVEAERPEE